MFIFRFAVFLTAMVILFSSISASAQASSFPQMDHATEASRRRLQEDILARYGIIVANRTAEWSMDELASVQAGLDSIAAEFSAIAGHDATSALKELLQGAVFYRDRGSDRIAYTIGGVVYVYDYWTTFDETGRAFYLAHEIGHLLDTRSSLLHLFMGEVSDEFARAVGAYNDEKNHYQLGQNFPHHDTPGSIRHRSDSASEDWAESFATVVVPKFESNLRDIGDARQSQVCQRLYQWSVLSAYAAD